MISFQRLLIESEELAEVLFDRVKGFMSDIIIEGDPRKSFVHGVEPLLQGTWTPVRLNKVAIVTFNIIATISFIN